MRRMRPRAGKSRGLGMGPDCIGCPFKGKAPIEWDGVMIMRNLILFGVLCSTGCSSQTGPDANTGVFKTPEQAGEARRQKLMLDWQEMALRIANADRPDIRTIKAPGFA